MSIKISIKNLHKSFNTKKVLTGVNLDVETSQSLVIIGGSGSGKSVLLKNIIGLIAPEEGSIEIDGKEVTNLSQRKQDQLMKKIGFLFQGGALFDSLSIWQNVSFGLMQTGMASNKAKDIAIEKLNSVGLESKIADLYPAELSGGMQKRVGLARAIAGNPEIIFFDEPTTGLDPIMANIINDLITKCSQEIGATTVTITHDMESVRKIASKVAMLHEGKIVWEGQSGELETTDNPFIKQFIHGSAEGPIKVDV
ncbi:MAG: ABC transporter ATP-binding protein [Alphaproteobacteria bacterium]